MITEKEPVHRTGSRMLLLPFSLIIISAIIALFDLTYILASYFHIYQPSNSFIEGFLFAAVNALVVPLFAMGVALLLMFLTRANRGMATRSRQIFLGGAFLFIVGYLFSIAAYWLMYSNRGLMEPDFDLEFQLSLTGVAATTIGTALCAIAIVLLTRCYMKGEITGNLRPKQQPPQPNQ
jgi:hypothetical protein